MSFPSGGTVTLNFADMIGSLFKDISQVRESNADAADDNGAPQVVCDADEALLSAGSVVRKIALRSGFGGFIDAADLVQTVFLRLLKWQRRRPDSAPEPSADEWRAIGAKTAFNEVKRGFAKKKEVSGIGTDGVEALRSASPAAETEAEIVSLARAIWREVTSLTTTQIRALVLHNDELVFYFLRCGVSEEELCETLGFAPDEWRTIAERLPLTDADIAAIPATAKSGRVPTAGAVRKARFEARRKLGRMFQR